MMGTILQDILAELLHISVVLIFEPNEKYLF